MALRSNDLAPLYSDAINAIQIPTPWPNPCEKASEKDELDVPDISVSFHTDYQTHREPQSKQYRRKSHPRETTSCQNCHCHDFITNQNTKIKHVEKAYDNTSPKLNDEKQCCFSKREDSNNQECCSVLPYSQKLPKTTHSTVSFESDMWEHFKKQDAKLDAIQEQVKCLLSQGEQIQKLQEQMNWVMLNMSRSDKFNSCPINMEFPNIASGQNPNMLEGFLKSVDNQNNSPSPKDIEVSKQSTSNMTSMTFNGNEKFLIHKKLTVVTDSAKYQKEVSAQCSYISNGVNSPLNRTPTKDASTSIQKSLYEAEKVAKSVKKNLVASGALDVTTPKDVIHSNPIRISPSDEKTHRKTAKVGITESHIEKYLPNYQNILKKVNEVIGENENQPVLPTKKTTPKETSKPKSRKSPLPRTSPLQIKENEKPCNCCSSSDSSYDSTHITPKSRKKRTSRNKPEKKEVENESYTKARYGLSSPNLSVATIQYLENYGLIRDKASEPRKKGRGSLPKRYTN